MIASGGRPRKELAMTAANPKGGRRFDCGGFSGLDHLPLTLAGLRVSGTLAVIGFFQLSSRFRHGGTLLVK